MPQNIRLAYRNIKKNNGSKTAGTDNRTIKDLERFSDEQLIALVERKLSWYVPQSVRRIEIPKGNDPAKKRPLGIPTIMDRLIQQCVLQVLEPICEAKFHDQSYGFRPNRSQKNAISKVYNNMQLRHLHYVVDIDIKGFFDLARHGEGVNKSKTFKDPCGWGASTIANILKKYEYLGHTVNFKTRKHFKDKKSRYVDESEWTIFENTHEAIIDEETWELAHRLRKTIRKPSYPDRPANPLTGLVYCADCGHKLTHRQPSPNKEKIFDADNAYVCGSYRQLTRDCSMHFIKTSALQDLILSAIREVSTFVRSDEKEFLHLVREETNAGIEIEVKEQKKRLHNLLEVDRAANERLAQLMPQIAKAAGITEQLKATDQMKWVGLMNMLKHRWRKLFIQS